MVERVYASLGAGPAINCRPHGSRQRVDLDQLGKLGDLTPGAVMAALLGDAGTVKVTASQPRPRSLDQGESEDTLADADRMARRAWDEQQAVLSKLRTIAEDALSFEQETGMQALQIGFPLLHVPVTAERTCRYTAPKRVLAPIAFVPISLVVKTGRSPAVEIASAARGAERVIPNLTLLSWIRQQTGEKLDELFDDEGGTQPWVEINTLVTAVCKALGIAPPAPLAPTGEVRAAPRPDAEHARVAGVVQAAVLGLYPLSNQSILRDLEAMADGEALAGPIESFLSVDLALAQAPLATTPRPESGRGFAEERLVSAADPCQARAVALARASRGLVVHGPPGTGKSQTIANVIGDHLARGQRVLFVCDKRTALDVVKYRLDHLGLGGLCAVVHDARRDQRDLYLGVREQLDGLAEAKPNPGVITELAAVDRELDALHGKLTSYDQALLDRPGGAAPSFHELVGRWLELEGDSHGTTELATPGLDELGPCETGVREVLERGLGADYRDNPWRGALGLDLRGYLARPVADWQRAVDEVVSAAGAADQAAADGLPAFSPAGDVVGEGEARSALAERLAASLAEIDPQIVDRWTGQAPDVVARAQAELEALRPQLDRLTAKGDDRELALVQREQPAPVGQVVLWIGRLAAYLQIARKWYRWFCFGRTRAARAILARFGLALAPEPAERTTRFLEGVRARTLLDQLLETTLEPGSSSPDLPDAAVAAKVRAHAAAVAAVVAIDGLPGLADLRRRLGDPDTLPLLGRARARSRAIAHVTGRLESAGLFAPELRQRIDAELRAGGKVQLYFAGLARKLETVEALLRMDDVLVRLPPALASCLRTLAHGAIAPDEGWRVVSRAVVAGELARRLRDRPELQEIDADRVRALHDRYRVLEDRKRTLVRDAALHLWTTRQRDRLLASTGSRLNNAGAELRRRLMLRGERAMRVRQVIAAGTSIEGGDPLFELRPVWMASPETVAQIFPRRPIFDIVIFDEASQCRLEEALPVLTRAERVVIAGDPKQLPPTRFFESTVAGSTEAEAESDQELFEEQQAEVEDLLGAALNLEIEQCYLDVHYRSRNPDLIDFSNRSFYDARLQPIPGHPRNRAPHAPLRLYRVRGVLDRRANPVEAEQVVAIVKELLARATPPSIGIACFNLTQRDVILEALDQAAANDPAFAAQLAAARTRRGAASFEGLFVKNLENVQGDERDHLIISTTYGPDPRGRFYRRFGPLGLAGGGRRLNVLVTRARDEVHLVTSIPEDAYRSLPPVAPGKTPNGAWLLFAYLKFAEDLAAAYAADDARLAAAQVARVPHVDVRATPSGSPVALAFARRLAARDGQSSDVHWGNDGFCVDVALHHPRHAEDVTLGVLCDGSRFDKAADRVEWDLFSTRVLEAQGWQLFRLWTPQLYRDPDACARQLQRAVDAFLAAEPPAPAPASAPGATLPPAQARIVN